MKKGESEFEAESKVLQRYLELSDEETDSKKRIKEVETTLDINLLRKYNALAEDEIKDILVNDKWLTSIHSSVKSEMDNISQGLARRINELTERYENTLPELAQSVEEHTAKVEEHLKEMGFKW